MIVKGPITKIHSYDDPKLFNVKNAEDKKLYRICYNWFFTNQRKRYNSL